MPLNYTTTITIIRTKSIVHHTPSATHEPSICITVLHMNVIKALLLAASQLEWSTFRVCLEADSSKIFSHHADRKISMGYKTGWTGAYQDSIV